MKAYTANRKKKFYYLLIPLALLILISIACVGAWMLPLILDWVEQHENCYSDAKAYSEGHKHEFLPDHAKDICVVTELDNSNAWMTFKYKDTLTLDASVFVELDPVSSGIKILPVPTLFWWSKKWRKEVDEFWSSNIRLKIVPPLLISWWPEDLEGREVDTKHLKQKYRFFLYKESK
jgi:hypothetical protein